MSVFTEDGQRCQLPLRRTFVEVVLEDWADGQPRRCRALAALLLRTEACSFDFIARALGCADRSSAKKLVESARKALRRRYPDAPERFGLSQEA